MSEWGPLGGGFCLGLQGYLLARCYFFFPKKGCIEGVFSTYRSMDSVTRIPPTGPQIKLITSQRPHSKHIIMLQVKALT